MSFSIVPLALLLGVFALPFGLLPSALLFRDLANEGGTAGRERAYAAVVWGGLLAAYAVGATGAAAIILAMT